VWTSCVVRDTGALLPQHISIRLHDASEVFPRGPRYKSQNLETQLIAADKIEIPVISFLFAWFLYFSYVVTR
jgi:hypothetical protein